MSSTLGEWREGKVRPVPGNTPRNRPVSRGILMLWSICDDPFDATRFPQLQVLPGPSVGVFKAWRNLSGPMGFQNQNQLLGRDHTASRWSAPSPGQTTRREDHALSHRPQMSSGRLFLDRVARQHCPSPLHRRSQNNTQFPNAQAKDDISTLPGRRHFYFALTDGTSPFATVRSVWYPPGLKCPSAMSDCRRRPSRNWNRGRRSLPILDEASGRYSDGTGRRTYPSIASTTTNERR